MAPLAENWSLEPQVQNALMTRSRKNIAEPHTRTHQWAEFRLVVVAGDAIFSLRRALEGIVEQCAVLISQNLASLGN